MSDRGVTYLERRMGGRARARLPAWAAELLVFGLKLAWAMLFGILILAAIIVTRLIWSDDWALARYDGLVVFAVATQILFLWTRLETLEEAKVILIFHVSGTAMEVFKLSQGSWDYPDQGVLEIGGVPLFSGFMYAAVGSFIARSIRIFRVQFAPYPPYWATYLLAVAIYVNFFAHHFTIDMRWLLFPATLLLFVRTRIWFFPTHRPRWIPLPLAALLAAVLMWIAENIGTLTRTWLYAGQSAHELVPIGKLGSWYLLLFVSFVTVTLVMRDAMHRQPVRPTPREIY